MFHNKSKNSNGTEMINVTKHPAYSFNVSTMVKKLSVCELLDQRHCNKW